MPVPSPSQIENLARAAIDRAGLRGQDAPRLAQAMGTLFGQMLAMFAARTQVLPGVPAAVNPMTGSGSTVGPGRLLPPPAGGPSAAQLESMANAALQAAGLLGQDIPALAGVLASVGEMGLTLLCAQAQVAPGIAIAGFATAAPGRLV